MCRSGGANGASSGVELFETSQNRANVFNVLFRARKKLKNENGWGWGHVRRSHCTGDCSFVGRIHEALASNVDEEAEITEKIGSDDEPRDVSHLEGPWKSAREPEVEVERLRAESFDACSVGSCEVYVR